MDATPSFGVSMDVHNFLWAYFANYLTAFEIQYSIRQKTPILELKILTHTLIKSPPLQVHHQ